MSKKITYEIPEGTPAVKCKGCPAVIYWIKTAKGKNMPVDPDGQPHWGSCPARANFKRPKEKV